MARGLAGFSLLAGYERLKFANWRSRASLSRNFVNFVESSLPCFALDEPAYLFLSLALDIPSSVRRRLAQNIAEKIDRETQGRRLPKMPSQSAPSDGRIRIAYLAADFRRHPLYDVFQPVLKHHDRQEFEIILFSIGPDDKSEERQSLVELSTRFIDLRALDDAARAARIFSEAPDILVDLSGYTVLGAPSIMALRPAKLQFSYAGFLSSQGAPWVDYTILDQRMLLQEERPFWVERVAYQQGFPFVRPARAVDVMLEESRLHGGGAAGEERSGPFVYCAFHSTWKVNPESFSLWMEILRRTSDSVLWLLAENQGVRRNYLAAALAHGIAQERLQFAPPLSHREHLLRLRQAHLFLDTLGCGAHATSGEALVLGVPLLTLPGKAVHERYAAALLQDAGLCDLVAHSKAAYVEFAVRMAVDPSGYRRCRQRVAEAFSPDAILRHDRDCVKGLELAFRSALALQRIGNPPQDIVPVV